jgi:hypothetical protein
MAFFGHAHAVSGHRRFVFAVSRPSGCGLRSVDADGLVASPTAIAGSRNVSSAEW